MPTVPSTSFTEDVISIYPVFHIIMSGMASIILFHSPARLTSNIVRHCASFTAKQSPNACVGYQRADSSALS